MKGIYEIYRVLELVRKFDLRADANGESYNLV